MAPLSDHRRSLLLLLGISATPPYQYHPFTLWTPRSGSNGVRHLFRRINATVSPTTGRSVCLRFTSLPFCPLASCIGQTKSGRYITRLSVKTWTFITILTQSSSPVTANIYLARVVWLWESMKNWGKQTFVLNVTFWGLLQFSISSLADFDSALSSKIDPDLPSKSVLSHKISISFRIVQFSVLL